MKCIVAVVVALGCSNSPHVAPDGKGSNDPDASTTTDVAPDATPDAPDPEPGTTRRLAVGTYQSCAIHDDNTLWCWGSRSGSLATSAMVPTQIGTDAHWTAISITDYHACGIDNGSPYCWGFNSDYALGTGDTTTRPDPVQIDPATDWTQIAMGSAHGCGLRSGALYCWGTNGFGEAGAGTFNTVLTPTRLGTEDDWTAITAGYQATCGLRGTAATRTLWCWGNGGSGALGDGVDHVVAVPTQIGTATDWVDIVAGVRSACGRRADGSAWCWGASGFGLTPVQIGTTTDYVAMIPGSGAPCGIHGGTLSCKGGFNIIGPGDGTQTIRSSFVTIASGHTWRSVASGPTHACATDDTNAVWCWGRNGFGALGIGTQPDRTSYDHVGTASWSSVSMTSFNSLSCGLSGDAVYCWGGPGPQLGNTTGLARQAPGLVGTGFIDVTAGFDAACARKADHSLWCWGGHGTLGFATDAYVPVQIGTATDWDAFTVDQSTCGIRGGALYCWGNNYYGEVGDGTTTYRPTPVQIGSATDWTAIATRQFDTCGVRGGQLYCWGFRVTSSIPKAVTNGSSWMTIAMDTGGYDCGLRLDHSWWCAVNGNALQYHSGTNWAWADSTCGIKTDGTLWCGSTQVGTDTNWLSYAYTYPNSCGVHTDGALACLGDGHTGQLGLGDAWVLVPTPTL